MILGSFIKQPAETLDYDLDFDDALPSSDEVVSATVIAIPDTMTVYATIAGRLVKVWASGGTDKVKYKIEVTATTDEGRIKQDEFYLMVKEY